MVTPIVTEIRKPPADAGPDTFVADICRPGATRTYPTTSTGATR